MLTRQGMFVIRLRRSAAWIGSSSAKTGRNKGAA